MSEEKEKCARCGKELGEITVTVTGDPNEHRMKYCMECGAIVTAAKLKIEEVK